MTPERTCTSAWYANSIAEFLAEPPAEISDADLRKIDDRWVHRSFKGNRWERIKKPELQQYLLNAYRVLLTRARQGMVIFVPPGERDDPTRLPEMYEGVFEYLASVGVPVLGPS